jgi:hypothetical protein
VQRAEDDNLIQRNQDCGGKKWSDHTSSFTDTNDDAHDENYGQDERVHRARCCATTEF